MTFPERTKSDSSLLSASGSWLHEVGGGFVHFFRLLGTRFAEDKLMLNASALSFTSLLALVPLMTVSVSVFAAFPVGDRVMEQLQDYIFQNFVPAAGEVVQGHLEEFSRKASALTGPGFLFLIVTALMLMASIDRAFNDIWRVHRERRPLVKLLVYWAVITLGPILMGLSLVLTSYLLSLPFLTNSTDSAAGIARLLKWTPLMVSTFAFTLLYILVPLRRVPMHHALAGGVVSALLFEAAKKGFVAYLATFHTYEAIYGALAAVPIFLVWMFLAWMVTLLGAEITYCLGAWRTERPGDRHSLFRLLDVVAVLRALWLGQRRGEGQTVESLADRSWVAEVEVERLLEELARQNWATLTEGGNWLLSRDLGTLRLSDLYNEFSLVLPTSAYAVTVEKAGFPMLAQRLVTVGRELDRNMDVSLKEIIERQE